MLRCHVLSGTLVQVLYFINYMSTKITRYLLYLLILSKQMDYSGDPNGQLGMLTLFQDFFQSLSPIWDVCLLLKFPSTHILFPLLYAYQGQLSTRDTRVHPKRGQVYVLKFWQYIVHEFFVQTLFITDSDYHNFSPSQVTNSR